MQGANGEQGADRDAVLVGAAVAEDHEGDLVAKDGGLGLLAHLVQPLREQRLLPHGPVRHARPRGGIRECVRHVERDTREAHGLLVEVQQRVEAARAQHGRVQEHAPAGLRPRVQQAQLRPDGAGQGHDVRLADGVDGRVRGLGEQLHEVVEGHLGQLGQARQRRVRTHRAERFVGALHHWRDEHVQLLVRVPEVFQQRQDALHNHRILGVGYGVVKELFDESLIF
mmetsp:Transcript_90221/g.255082  ORF Transcript_90221/g.255082 Transcript_90221/m.255082 type:complete len:226 (-) Transcript_90221:1042-1719(-)